MKDLWELNPRGNLWFNDSSKYGQKLLSKMGWTKGKGLGKHENGIKESIKIPHKSNNSGIGWDNQVKNDIFSQDYTELLTTLNENYPLNSHEQNATIGTQISLEKRSKHLKNRIHYQKLIKGKDVTQYSEKDIKSIFGGQLSQTKELVNETIHIEKAQQLEDIEENNLTNYKNSSMTISEYFDKKIKNKKVLDNELGDSLNFSRKRKKNNSVNGEINTKRIKLDEPQCSNFESQDTLSKGNSITNDFDELPSNNILSETVKNENGKNFPILNVYNLKSCLKKENTSQNSARIKKKVTFNENISYRIINTTKVIIKPKQKAFEEELNKDGEIILKNSNTENFDESSSSLNDQEMLIASEDEHLKHEMLDETSNINNLTDDLLDHFDEKTDMLNTYSQLPVFPNSNYTSWVNYEKQLTKAKKLKIKKLTKHKILKTTNLLNIKGYGNW